MARIAMIDDLIHPALLKQEIGASYLLMQDEFRNIPQPTSDRYTHGTLVTKVFESYATQYEIINVAILEDWAKQKVIPSDTLKKALEFCLQIDVDAINISVGTQRLSDIRFVGQALKAVSDANIPIIAACSNDWYRTIPASCQSVFGVVADQKNTLHPGQYIVQDDCYLGANFVANYELSVPQAKRFVPSNSLATPVVTAKVNQLINAGVKTIAQLMGHLNSNAIHKVLSIQSEGHHTVNMNDIPVVCVVDIFSQNPVGQIELLNVFSKHGYETMALSELDEVDDVRVLSLCKLHEMSFSKIKQCIIKSSKCNVVIAFISRQTAPAIQSLVYDVLVSSRPVSWTNLHPSEDACNVKIVSENAEEVYNAIMKVV